ncbi:type II toxin-antitoxin system HicB family antitoxin, partial [Actinoplanes cyaneus]
SRAFTPGLKAGALARIPVAALDGTGPDEALTLLFDHLPGESLKARAKMAAGADRDREVGGTIVSVADHYTYRVRWSAEDGEYVGTVAELPSVSWLAEDRLEAFIGIQRVAEEIVADMEASGETPPVAIADRSYSGKFQVRVPEEVHRRLAIRAAEQGVSLNALASSRLAGA